MTAHQPGSRRPHHNKQPPGRAANQGGNGANPVDPVDVATCRLWLTDDGWYLGSDPIADQGRAGRIAVRRRAMQQDRPDPVLVIAVDPDHVDLATQDALRAAVDTIRSAVWSHRGSGDLPIELTIISPRAGRDG